MYSFLRHLPKEFTHASPWGPQVTPVTYKCISHIGVWINVSACYSRVSLEHGQFFFAQWVTFVNPLHAKFFRGNINIYLHFMPLLHIDKSQDTSK